jgi:carbon storage regulator
MIAFAREVGETITIGDDIQVTVLQIADGKVTIGVHSKQLLVYRGEVYDEFKRTRNPHRYAKRTLR